MTAPVQSLPLFRLLQHTAEVVRAVREGRSLTDALLAVPSAARAGTQSLAFATMRRLGLATALRQQLAPRAPRPDIDALLLTALALLSMEGADAPYTEHTLVDQAVAATRKAQAASAGFVNAVLRRYLRERTQATELARRDPVALYNHPRWWIEQLQRDWPDTWSVLLDQAQRQPPMTLRVNTQRTDVPTYLKVLAAAGIEARALDPAIASEAAILLTQPCPVAALPGFVQGDVSVQDAAAQRAAPLLLQGLPRGQALRVLDACAAPGGKAAHLLEMAPSLQVLALDSDASRLERVHENLARLHLRAEVRAGDARQPDAWWDGTPFDAILLDAPCSASGIVRRHPDIPWLRRASDVVALAQTQAQLLQSLWSLLAPGGVMVYASCSLFKAEGEHQIDAFLQRPTPSPPKLDAASPGHLQPLPDNSGHTAVHDGFFYARLHKPR